MELRQLGKDGPKISVLGCGTWTMGSGIWPEGWGPRNDDASIAAVRAALDGEITWIDTAPVYGIGHSEEIVGRALGARRKDVFLASKFGLLWDEHGYTKTTGVYAKIMKECEDSLRRLNTDYIDLYQHHWPDIDDHAPVEETIRAQEDLVKAGKVRYIGVSNYNVPLLKQAVAAGHVTSVQPRYNVLDRSVEAEILPFCREHGIGVVVYSPLEHGWLAGSITAETKLSSTDWRSRDFRFRGEGLRRNLAIVDRLRPIAARLNCTLAQLSLAWILANPTITAAILGTARKENLDSSLPAASLKLDAATLAEIDAASAIRVLPQ
jgi:aryl-alcohol dehydrogenase-like predicted oxidoreductase